jgi:hypothetical protein
MLFARNALASGPQARLFAEKVIAKVKMGRQRIHVDKTKTMGYR